MCARHIRASQRQAHSEPVRCTPPCSRQRHQRCVLLPKSNSRPLPRSSRGLRQPSAHALLGAEKTQGRTSLRRRSSTCGFQASSVAPRPMTNTARGRLSSAPHGRLSAGASAVRGRSAPILRTRMHQCRPCRALLQQGHRKNACKTWPAPMPHSDTEPFGCSRCVNACRQRHSQCVTRQLCQRWPAGRRAARGARGAQRPGGRQAACAGKACTQAAAPHCAALSEHPSRQ